MKKRGSSAGGGYEKMTPGSFFRRKMPKLDPQKERIESELRTNQDALRKLGRVLWVTNFSNTLSMISSAEVDEKMPEIKDAANEVAKRLISADAIFASGIVIVEPVISHDYYHKQEEICLSSDLLREALSEKVENASVVPFDSTGRIAREFDIAKAAATAIDLGTQRAVIYLGDMIDPENIIFIGVGSALKCPLGSIEYHSENPSGMLRGGASLALMHIGEDPHDNVYRQITLGGVSDTI